MTPFDLGWLCGLLEGDGTFTYDGNYPRIAVKMTDLYTVQRAADLLGATVNGPYEPIGAIGTREVYITYINADRATSMMQVVRSHMSLRRQNQIDVLLGGQTELFEFPRAI